MNILHVSKSEVLGGAERIAHLLYQGIRARGENTWLAVDEKKSADEHVFQIPPRPWSSITRALFPTKPTSPAARRLREYAANPGAFRRAILGQDSFAYPGTRRLLSLPSQRPDILHLHNLHGSYFDLRILPRLSRQLPVVLTMHDAWLLTGGCTHPLDCTRYLDACGHCPYRHLHFRAAIIDSTAFNHRRKKRILTAARLHIVTPCRWLMEKIPGTMLEPAVVTRHIIPNGVDTTTFHPADKAAARAALALPQNARILLHASVTPTRNASKDFPTMRATALRVAATLAPRNQQLLFLVVGEERPPEQLALNAELRFLPFTPDPAAMARCYAAADVYLQASLADTFPNTILEAMACGCPVVATAVGGIPEQFVDNDSGLLVDSATPETLATAILSLLTDSARHTHMVRAALARIQKYFTLNHQLNAHLALYHELLEAKSS